MKKLFTLLSICIITSLIVSSCSSSSFITKRRYTKGYYVSHTHSRHAPPARPAAEKEKAEPGTAVTAAPKTVAEPALLPPKTAETEKAGIAKKSSAAHRKHKMADQKALRGNGPDNTIGLSLSERSDPYKTTLSLRPSADSEDDALSLFWIVIIVILVLYLLGVISGGWGLGFLIHLLLVLALILLILWLLRIL